VSHINQSINQQLPHTATCSAPFCQTPRPALSPLCFSTLDAALRSCCSLSQAHFALPSSSGGERFASGHPCSAAPSHIAVTGSATCVQNLDDSLGSAIRTTYRISLRSSSVQEPRHPLHRVVFLSLLCVCVTQSTCLCSLSHCVSLLSLNPPLLSLLLQSLE